jgi:hypothetical protein
MLVGVKSATATSKKENTQANPKLGYSDEQTLWKGSGKGFPFLIFNFLKKGLIFVELRLCTLPRKP